jgi:cellulose synthase/poly-beta-1,6-N-acetylglucosamine synthase-like glycosyltransferase
MTTLGWILVGLPTVVIVYAYLGYPAILKALTLSVRRRPVDLSRSTFEWPAISISLPAHNEEARIRGALDALLAVDYPAERREILVISDASTDGTDDIVREYSDRGVGLLRVPERGGKTAAENAGAERLSGEIVVNTDASIRVLPDSLKPLIRAFADPEVGVASGRDRSVGSSEAQANEAEAGYVGYEMWVRRLETMTGSIVGASGCYYAIRRELHRKPLPDVLSRDFASALLAREHGYRAVSIDDAVCLVPRTGSLRVEFRRKIRTMARGLETLCYKRRLLNPFVFGGFAWRFFSHKLCRWLAALSVPLVPVGLALLSARWPWAIAPAVLGVVMLLVGAAALWWPFSHRPPRVVALCGYALSATMAASLAWLLVIRGKRSAIWEPTRRADVQTDANRLP